MFTEVRYINNMDPVCYGRTFITDTSDLATLVKCQLGVMEEPKESTDKVSWTVYGRSPPPLKWGISTIRFGSLPIIMDTDAG